MQVVDFFGLERSVQDRFIEAAQGTVPPLPLAFVPARPGRGVWLWGAVSAVSALSALAWLGFGFGELDSPRALLALPQAAFVALACALAAFAALRAHAAAEAQSGLPFRAGIYLFPVGLVDARSGTLRVHYFVDLSQAEARGLSVRLKFDEGARFEFSCPNAEAVARLMHVVEAHRQRLSGDFGPPSQREVAGLDPLADTGFRSPFTPSESRTRGSARFSGFSALLVAPFGALLGWGAFHGRNILSEERIYAEARARQSVDGYRAYLARGGARADVSEVLLPRAELLRARAAHSVQAIEEYAAAHPHSKISSEVSLALKEELLLELERRASQHSLSALIAFEREQPSIELVRPELTRRKAELYRSAALRFSAAAQPNTQGVRPFFDRLLAYSQQHGPKVSIRFRQRVAESVEKAEERLKKSAYYMGSDSLPSQFFDAASMQPRLSLVAEALAARLGREFPPDILRFELGPGLEDDGQDNPPVSEPTLLITHRTEMSGAFLSKQPRAAFVGIGVMVRAVLALPGDSASVAYKFVSWQQPNLRRWELGDAAPRDIYDGAAREGLDRFTKKYLGHLLKSP